MVRLGSGAGDMKQLSPDAIERGVAALAPLPPDRRRLRRAGPGGRHQRRARGRERRRVPAPGPRGGRRRGRGDLRRRGGPPHPPRRPAGAARLRPPAAAVRHRRRQHRVPRRRARRDAGVAQPEARRHPPHRRASSRATACTPAPSTLVPPLRAARSLAPFAEEIEAHGFEVAVGSLGHDREPSPSMATRRRRRAAAADAQRCDVHARRAGSRSSKRLVDAPHGRRPGAKLPGLDAAPGRHHRWPGRSILEGVSRPSASTS